MTQHSYHPAPGAALRANTRSLLNPILAHIAANLAGIPAGTPGVILYRLLFGTFPDFSG